MRTLSPCSERRLAGLAVTLGVLLAVTACGGGGGGSASDGGSGGGAAATVGVPSPPSSAGGASTGAGGSTLVALDAGTSCQLPDFRNSLLQAINAARAVARSCGGTAMPAVAPLAWNDALFAAAARHSTDMAVNNYFSHTGLDGRSAAQRIAAITSASEWMRRPFSSKRPPVERA